MLKLVSDLRPHSEGKGKNVLFISDYDIDTGIKKDREYDDESDSMILANAAEIARRCMFEEKRDFSGLFDAKCPNFV